MPTTDVTLDSNLTGLKGPQLEASLQVFVVGRDEAIGEILASRNDDHLLQWIVAILLLVGFGLGDTAIIAWCASLVTVWQLGAVLFSFVLVAAGLCFTVWQMRRCM
jgi:hypothetical protein